jgi:hypothetical protein
LILTTPQFWILVHGVVTQFVNGATNLKTVIQKACVGTIAMVMSVCQAVARIDKSKDGRTWQVHNQADVQ